MDVPPFEVAISWSDGEPTVHIRGELDFATAPALHEALEEALRGHAQSLVLDFHQVTFLDSEGLKVLLQAYRELRARGGSLTVTGCSQFVAKTFEILGLDRYFDIGGENPAPRG